MDVMARYVTPEIEDIRANPEPGETIDLALVVSDEAIEDIKQRVNEFRGHVERHLPSDVLLVRIPETELDEFCKTDSLESVSEPDRMQTMQ